MQTISIAVSAILIAAGLITAPGLINNAKDTNARHDLASISTAQEYSMSNDGVYTSSPVILLASPSLKVHLSTGIMLGLFAGTNCYAAFVKSVSGSYFYRNSGSSATNRVPLPWPVSAPTGYPAGCAWPASSSAAVASVSPAVASLLAEASINEMNITGTLQQTRSIALNSATGYTVAASWSDTSSASLTVMGKEGTFKMQQGGTSINYLISTTGWGWTSINGQGGVASETGATNWAVDTVGSGSTTQNTVAGPATAGSVPASMSDITINGYGSGRETVGTSGTIFQALVWGRTLTPAEVTTISTYLASLS